MGLFKRARRRERMRNNDAGDDLDAPSSRHAPDPSGFAAVYDRYADAILRYCQVRIDDPADAEDAAAQIFTKAFAAFPPRDHGSLRSWLFAIAHNVIANHYRTRQARGPSRPLDDALHLPDPALPPDELAARSDERRALRQALARLPSDQRRVIEPRLSGLTGPEIAQVMERSHAAVKMLQLRAVDRLRDLLAPPASNHSDADPILEESHARHPR
jgi:RNA polymerase sigma-70 factor (ECF subfamily)